MSIVKSSFRQLLTDEIKIQKLNIAPIIFGTVFNFCFNKH